MAVSGISAVEISENYGKIESGNLGRFEIFRFEILDGERSQFRLQQIADLFGIPDSCRDTADPIVPTIRRISHT